MKNSEKFERAFNYFKQSYCYKMGGTQTVILPNGKSKEFDDREYYSGRGAKYNANIRHDIIGDVKVSRKDYSEFLKQLKENEKARKKRDMEKKEKEMRIKEAKGKGVYSISDNGYIELSESEHYEKNYCAERLANTLGVSVHDAKLLRSTGKTYVFARSSNGKIYEMYHPDLSCNGLSIHISEATPERIAEFNWDKWSKAPFGGLVGATNNRNHFVC